MKYCSTRDDAPSLEFSDVLLTGLARDGGLYVPEHWPELSFQEMESLAGRPYSYVAEKIITPFVGNSINQTALRDMIQKAYGRFAHPAVAPLVQTDSNEFLLELFHGPTLAFKDIAMQLIGLLMDHVLEKRGIRATVIGATSGDTGGAAIDAFKNRQRTDTFILFPNGRVSEVQQRQMTTVGDENSHAVAINGTFDDCQGIVKGLFNDLAFRDKVNLAGVNSINWSRIMAQVVYYFVAAVAVGAPHRQVNFTVPTGNFGDIYAGYVAAKMGLPVGKLTIATNVNDILWRALETGRYEKQSVVATTSPSMDIQVSSNFERLLFEAVGRCGGSIRSMMDSLGQSGKFEIPADALEYVRSHFNAGRSSEEKCAETIDEVWKLSGYILDPHTAIALSVARQQQSDGENPMIVLATAHPSKFPDSVERACGTQPEMPERLKKIMGKPEKFTIMEPVQDEVGEYILANARSVGRSG